MFRILGFIVGSAASIAAILFFVGMPDFKFASTETDQARFDDALAKIREKQPGAKKVVDDIYSGIEQVAAQIVETQSDIAVADEAATDEPAVEIPDVDNSDSSKQAHDANQHSDTVAHWHEFWNPFRSEIAAKGFVSQLEKVTGLDYRVVKIKTGVYQVGFAYDNDEERRIKVAQISAATGLDLPES